MPTASQAAAGASFVVFAAAAAWLVLSEFPVPDPGRPTTKAPGLQLLEAAVPAIGDFASFNVNKENPFIPYNLRDIEKITIDRPKLIPKQPPKGPSPIVPDKPQLPRLAAPGQTGPAATGIVISKDGPQALLTFPGTIRGQLLRPGETANGWTLVDVINGNVARVRQNSTGSIQDLVIPETLTLRAAEAPAKDAKSNPKAPGNAAEIGKKSGKKPDKGQSPKPAEGADQKLEAPPKSAQPAPAIPQPPAIPRPDKLM